MCPPGSWARGVSKFGSGAGGQLGRGCPAPLLSSCREAALARAHRNSPGAALGSLMWSHTSVCGGEL